MKTKILNSLTAEFVFAIFLIYGSSQILNQLNILTLFNLFLLSLIFNLFFYKYKFLQIQNILKLSLLTVFLMNWSLAITGKEYLVYSFDWDSFGVAINLMNDPLLYSSDLLAKQAFPHFWMYKLVSVFIGTKYFSTLFYVGFIIQNLFLAKSFQIIKQNVNPELDKSNLHIILILPLLLYPQISGHYTSLPFFLPMVLAYSLTVFNISNFIFRKNSQIEDYLFLILLVFIHPFWSIFVPLYLAICYIVSKETKNKYSVPLIVIFLFALFNNTFDGISIMEIYNSELINFYKSFAKIHFDWAGHFGVFFRLGLNNAYQQVTMLIIIAGLILKNKLIYFKTLESTFYTSLGWISLLIVLGNFFYSSSFNNLLLSSNFHRIGSLTWFFIGIFIYKNFSNNILLSLLTIFPLIFYSLSHHELYKKSINLLPNINFSSKYAYIFIAIAVFLFTANKLKESLLITIAGALYLFIFEFIDKVAIENYLIKSFSFSFILFLLIYFLTDKFDIKPNFVIFNILILFMSSTLFISSIFNNIELEYKTEISKENILTIQKYTDKSDVILIDLNMPYFRKETQRGVLFEQMNFPYNEESLKIYYKYRSLFNGKYLYSMDKDEVVNIINNSNCTDLILPLESISLNYFKNNFEYYKLDDFGYLFLNVNTK